MAQKVVGVASFEQLQRELGGWVGVIAHATHTDPWHQPHTKTENLLFQNEAAAQRASDCEITSGICQPMMMSQRLCPFLHTGSG